MTRDSIAAVWRSLPAAMKEAMTFTPRATTAGVDTFPTGYSLRGVCRKQASRDEMIFVGASPDTEVWRMELYRADWAAVSAPDPKPRDRLTDASGVVYWIARISRELIDQRFTCTAIRGAGQ